MLSQVPGMEWSIHWVKVFTECHCHTKGMVGLEYNRLWSSEDLDVEHGLVSHSHMIWNKLLRLHL